MLYEIVWKSCDCFIEKIDECKNWCNVCNCVFQKWSDLQKSSKNHMNMQNLVLFVKKNLKINILKLKDTLKFKIIGIIQGNIEVLHITYVV